MDIKYAHSIYIAIAQRDMLGKIVVFNVHYTQLAKCCCIFQLNIADHMLLDIDECSTGEHNCTHNQQCVNNPGDYQCECVSGYELLNGNCEGNVQLMQLCVQF